MRICSMKNTKKKLTALALTTVFAVMQVSAEPVNTGLGVGINGSEGSIINSTSGGYTGLETGTDYATLKFNGNAHVNWDTLNLYNSETLNFNAESGVSGITVLNTVTNGMSRIEGQIKTNAGIGNLIISNPNGVLLNGAKFTTAADTDTKTNLMITTQALANPANVNLANPQFAENGMAAVQIYNTDFTVGGNINIIGDTLNVVNSVFNAKGGNGDVRFTTTNGQDYFVTAANVCVGDSCSGGHIAEKNNMSLEAVQVNGNVYIKNNKGYVRSAYGGTINGNLDIESGGSVSLNNMLEEVDGKIVQVESSNPITVTGNVDIKANGTIADIRGGNVGGHLNIDNGGGFVEVRNTTVGGDMNLTTNNVTSENPNGYRHFVHVSGNTEVGGNATIDSKHNIHIGNYDFENGQLLDGNFKVNGNLTAHAHNGHVMTTINTQANKIDYKAEYYIDSNGVKRGGNVLTDDQALLTANEYKFSSEGYIGGLKGGTDQAGNTYTTADRIIDVMENYKHIPLDTDAHAYTHIAGGKITQINAPQDSQVYIASNGDVVLTGANAGNINLTADRKRIDIEGPDVHAQNINIGPETDYLKVEFESRDYTTNFTNIKDETVVTIAPNQEITYELADGGNNLPTLVPGEKTTYLFGPEAPDPCEPDPTPVDPDPTPVDPDPCPCDPDPIPCDPDPTPVTPDPIPTPQPEPVHPSYTDNNENARNLMTEWTPEDIDKPLVGTPVAFAADLDDDDEDAAVRKNVDGSVTVVRAYPIN